MILGWPGGSAQGPERCGSSEGCRLEPAAPLGTGPRATAWGGGESCGGCGISGAWGGEEWLWEGHQWCLGRRGVVVGWGIRAVHGEECSSGGWASVVHGKEERSGGGRGTSGAWGVVGVASEEEGVVDKGRRYRTG